MDDTGRAGAAISIIGGDATHQETVAAAALVREHLPDLDVRVVTVVDLMRLQPAAIIPMALPDHWDADSRCVKTSASDWRLELSGRSGCAWQEPSGRERWIARFLGRVT